MRSVVMILLLCAFNKVSAQHLTGKVIDGTTSRPISNVTVTSSSSTVFTRANGQFELPNPRIGDTIKMSCVGYKPFSLKINTINSRDTLLIRLQPSLIILNPVTIKGVRDYKADSVRNRKEYSSEFNYKAPGLKDIFVNRSNTANVPSFNQTPNNTTEILSVNLLAIIALAGKNKTPESKFQKTLLRDEEAGYVDHLFSREKVINLTHLRGDSLQDFMDKYRPLVQQLKAMTTYDLIVYIKHSYSKFIKTYHHGDTSPFKK